MDTQIISQTKHRIVSSLLAKIKLLSINLFDRECMQKIYDNISDATNMNSYISTFIIEDGYIRLTLRKTFFKKFNNSLNAMDYYPIIDKYILRIIEDNKEYICSALSDEEYNILTNNLALLYYVYLLNENTLVIDFRG